MAITVTNKELVFLDIDSGEYRPFQDGDDINLTYVHINLSSPLDLYICGWWDVTAIQTEIDNALVAANIRETDSVNQVSQLKSLVGD